MIWTNFLHFLSCLLVETTTFVERSLWKNFHQVSGLQNEQSLLLTQTCFNCKRKWFVGLFVLFFGQLALKALWTNRSLTHKALFFPVDLIIIVWCQSIISQKCRSRFSKANFYSKTVGHLSQSIDYFCLLSINYFLRNGARNSQNRTFGRRQWAQYFLFLFFT